MSDPSVTRFLVEFTLDDQPERTVMKAAMQDVTSRDILIDGTDQNGRHPPAASTDPALDATRNPTELAFGPTPPYGVGLALRLDRTGTLRPDPSSLFAIPTAPRRPFDPALAGDDGVLSIDDWRLSDHRLETQDSTTLRLFLRNRSNYYEAQRLGIWLHVLAPTGDNPGTQLRPDHNEYLSIYPERQSLRRLEPQQTQPLDYLIVTRGLRAGLYSMIVEATYDLVYVYRETCHRTTARASLPLRIHGGSEPPLPGGLIPCPAKSERISITQRRLHMSEPAKKDVGQSFTRALHPIERKVILPGGGKLSISYRLVKGSHTRPDGSRGSFGINPQTKEIECYFSTEDEAAMEITIRNESDLRLKHINLTDLHLFEATTDDVPGARADTETLPDGNHLFEALPSEVYFGGLCSVEDPEPATPRDDPRSRTRYVGLITRGVKPGRFLLHFYVRYEIVDGHAHVHLPISVNPD